MEWEFAGHCFRERDAGHRFYCAKRSSQPRVNPSDGVQSHTRWRYFEWNDLYGECCRLRVRNSIADKSNGDGRAQRQLHHPNQPHGRRRDRSNAGLQQPTASQHVRLFRQSRYARERREYDHDNLHNGAGRSPRSFDRTAGSVPVPRNLVNSRRGGSLRRDPADVEDFPQGSASSRVRIRRTGARLRSSRLWWWRRRRRGKRWNAAGYLYHYSHWHVWRVHAFHDGYACRAVNLA